MSHSAFQTAKRIHVYDMHARIAPRYTKTPVCLHKKQTTECAYFHSSFFLPAFLRDIRRKTFGNRKKKIESMTNIQKKKRLNKTTYMRFCEEKTVMILKTRKINTRTFQETSETLKMHREKQQNGRKSQNAPVFISRGKSGRHTQ